jgi:hypothetical protein
MTDEDGAQVIAAVGRILARARERHAVAKAVLA